MSAQAMRALLRQRKLDTIKQAIEDGTYQVSAHDVARKMIQKMGSDQADEDLQRLKRDLDDLCR